MVKLVDAGDSKSPAPRGHDGSTPSSGTKENKGLAIDADPFIYVEFVDCARSCARQYFLYSAYVDFVLKYNISNDNRLTLALTYNHPSPYNLLTKKELLIKSGHKLKFLSVLIGFKSYHYIVTRKRQHKGK